MILQAVSCLLSKSITLVILPLDRIGTEQAEYISRLGGRPCFQHIDSPPLHSMEWRCTPSKVGKPLLL
jgi:hypothetical protein